MPPPASTAVHALASFLRERPGTTGLRLPPVRPWMLVLLVGCGAAPRGPSAAVHAYAGALSSGDARGAWELLDGAAREGRTGAEHAAMFAENAEELAAQGRALAAAAPSARARARVALES